MKNYAEKIHAVNAFRAIHAALVENLTPVLRAAKFKQCGNFDKRTAEKVGDVLSAIAANYTEHHFRIHCKPSKGIGHIWVKCDFWARTGVDRGQYVKQAFLYTDENGAFNSYDGLMLSPASVQGAEKRHQELEKLIRELENERNSLRFNYYLNNYGEFV